MERAAHNGLMLVVRVRFGCSLWVDHRLDQLQ